MEPEHSDLEEDDSNSSSESESESDNSDLNADESMEVDDNMFEPLYDGANITVCGAFCAIMEFKRVCRLPFSAILMLLKLLQLLCPSGNKLPQSVYILKKFFQKHSSQHKKRMFCPECNTELKGKQWKCTNAGCQGKEPNYLITLKSDQAISNILRSKYTHTMHKHMHTHAYTYTRTCTHTCMHTYLYTHMYTHMHMLCTHYIDTHVHTIIHVHMHRYDLTCTCTHIHVCTHTHGHVYVRLDLYHTHICILVFAFTGNWKKLDYCLKVKNHVICDIHTGAGYRRLLNHEHIGAIFNTDGIQPFKSARLSIYPIFLALAGLPPSIRMNRDNIATIAIWVGGKPPMNVLLKPLTKTLKRLSSHGIRVKSPAGIVKTVRLHSLFGVFDLIARAPAMNMKQHNGYNGCPTCLHPGETKRHTRVYLPGTDYPLRTHNSIVQAGIQAKRDGEAVEGIKGKSPLASVIDLVNGIPIDYMHCVLEGVTKKLLETWMKSSKCAGYIGRYVKQIDKNLLKQRPPHDFSRAPRSIEKHRKYWKASELRNWLLYYSLPLLSSVLPPLYLHHFSLLVCAMHILLQSQLSTVQIQAADDMLVAFYELLPELYGDTSCPLNSHLLIHLTKYVRLWGPLWTHSAFGFESMNGHISSMIHSKHRIADQLVFSIDVSNTLSTIADQLLHKESEQTLSFLNPNTTRKKDMSELTPGTYSVGVPQSSHLSREERRAIQLVSTSFVNSSQVLTFHRLYHQGSMLHSVHYGRGEEGKRDSSVCCYSDGTVEHCGVIQKFCLCPSSPALVLIQPFQTSSTSLLKSIGNPGRHVLKSYADIDLLSAFFVSVSKQLLPVCAVPVSQLLCKCVRVSCSDLTVDYVVKIPNNYEHH